MKNTMQVLALATLMLLVGGCGSDDRADAQTADAGYEQMDAAREQGHPQQSTCIENERVVDGSCVPCGPGSRRDAGDDPAGPDTTCNVTVCVEDEYVLDHACVSCPAGETNVAGDPATGEDTTCDGALCPRDSYVAMGRCEPCPPGTTNERGDDPSLVDTQCDPIFCEANQRVLNHGCVACDAGTENVAGDDASGDDTDCEITYCELDQYVLDNACVACPAETTNDAGDPANGADTSCEDACSEVFGLICSEFEHPILSASTVDQDDEFGYRIAISGDWLAVGSPWESSAAAGINGDENDNTLRNAGAVWIYQNVAGSWQFHSYIKASHPGYDDRFGAAVALDGNTLVVGAPFDESDSTGVGGDPTNNGVQFGNGAVYVFERSNDSWTQTEFLKPAVARRGSFGFAVSLDGSTLAVGDPGDQSSSTGVGADPNAGPLWSAGAAYVFTKTNGQWSQQAYIKPSVADEDDAFGGAVDIDGDTVVVGVAGDDSASSGVGADQTDNSLPRAGAAYVFSRSGSNWSEQAYLKAMNPGQADAFGADVAISGEAVVVGSPGVDGNISDVGAITVFERSGSTWSEVYYGNHNYDGAMGTSVDIVGDRIVAGAPGACYGNAINGDPPNFTNMCGVTHYFTRANGVWTDRGVIKATSFGAGRDFGMRVAISPRWIIVSDPKRTAPFPDAGSVFIFETLP